MKKLILASVLAFTVGMPSQSFSQTGRATLVLFIVGGKSGEAGVASVAVGRYTSVAACKIAIEGAQVGLVPNNKNGDAFEGETAMRAVYICVATEN